MERSRERSARGLPSQSGLQRQDRSADRATRNIRQLDFGIPEILPHEPAAAAQFQTVLKAGPRHGRLKRGGSRSIRKRPRIREDLAGNAAWKPRPVSTATAAQRKK